MPPHAKDTRGRASGFVSQPYPYGRIILAVICQEQAGLPFYSVYDGGKRPRKTGGDPVMEPILRRKMAEKIDEVIAAGPVMKGAAIRLAAGAPVQFMLGAMAGRLYNAFYYQSRRLHGRDPTRTELEEFLCMLEDNWERLQKACG